MFKIRLEPAETPELDRLYAFVFDVLNCSWVGCTGHKPYNETPARRQDGYLYSFMHLGKRVITADSWFGAEWFTELHYTDTHWDGEKL